MDNYYNELSQLELLKQELDKLSYSLENNKAGCFKHRIEAFINILLNETRNQNYLRNNIQNYIKEANYSDDVKSYVMQVFLSFFEPIEFNIPKSLINVVNRNERLDRAMIEGHSNFKSVNNYTQSQELHKESLPPQQSEKPKPKQEQPETLGSIITHKEAETLVSGIKTQYKNIKGKRLKLLLIALQELELLPKERIAKKFHTLCNNEFNWKIASYNAMNGYNFNSHTDTDEVEGMKQYIKTLLNIK